MIYTIKEASLRVGRSVNTLQRWDRTGVLSAYRTKTNRRYYTQDQLDEFLGFSEESKQKQVVYLRVSSPGQKNDLSSQRKALEAFCIARGFAGVEYVEEIGGGLNFRRPQFLKLFEQIEKREVSHLIIAHKDRLARFGFDFFAYFCESHHCELLVLNVETLSPQAEMVQDLLAVVHCFSSRLYGLRRYKKFLRKDLQDEEESSP